MYITVAAVYDGNGSSPVSLSGDQPILGVQADQVTANLLLLFVHRKHHLTSYIYNLAINL